MGVERDYVAYIYMEWIIWNDTNLIGTLYRIVVDVRERRKNVNKKNYLGVSWSACDGVVGMSIECQSRRQINFLKQKAFGPSSVCLFVKNRSVLEEQKDRETFFFNPD